MVELVTGNVENGVLPSRGAERNFWDPIDHTPTLSRTHADEKMLSPPLKPNPGQAYGSGVGVATTR